ncbi:MAG TPA: YMGG-like glycine zipper-containing protein [Burkholderiaceae bacterium]|nr:YMGG-like glycine zipper-containing protein [Burkholderiaceae bacterium]
MSMLALIERRAPRRTALAVGVGLLWLAGCVEMPTGPTVAVMPAPNKPFEVFMQEDELCRGWAAHSIGQPGHEAAAEAFLKSTLTGAAVGAVAGALIGGDRGAGAGAAVGTVVGAGAGTNASGYTAASAQRRYDIAYQQCMYAKGNVVSNYPHPGYYPAPPPPPQ